MCIYYGDLPELTYKSREHVLPAALGCSTKLESGVVSDQANELFSPIERDVLEHSLIQIPRIINGPGKRGKLAEKYATTSEVSVITLDGKNGLGYMKGTEGYILSQFIIDENNNVQFHWQANEEADVQNEIEKLKNHICSMGEKYVPVKMPSDDNYIYITYFKNKLHIGYRDIELLSDSKIEEIKKLFSATIVQGRQSTSCGKLSTKIEVKHDFKKVCIVAIKSALNTLAYLKGATYITQTTAFKKIIKAVTSESDEVLNCVNGIGFDAVKLLRQRLYFDKEQLVCLLTMEGNRLKSWFFVYEYGFEITLCDTCTVSFDILLDGIVCDWKNRKDYRYLDFLREKGIWC